MAWSPLLKKETDDSPGDPVVKNPPSNTGSAGLVLSQGTKIPHAEGQLSLWAHDITREKPELHSWDPTWQKGRKKPTVLLPFQGGASGAAS